MKEFITDLLTKVNKTGVKNPVEHFKLYTQFNTSSVKSQENTDLGFAWWIKGFYNQDPDDTYAELFNVGNYQDPFLTIPDEDASREYYNKTYTNTQCFSDVTLSYRLHQDGHVGLKYPFLYIEGFLKPGTYLLIFDFQADTFSDYITNTAFYSNLGAFSYPMCQLENKKISFIKDSFDNFNIPNVPLLSFPDNMPAPGRGYNWTFENNQYNTSTLSIRYPNNTTLFRIANIDQIPPNENIPKIKLSLPGIFLQNQDNVPFLNQKCITYEQLSWSIIKIA